MEEIRKPLQGVMNIVRFNWHFYIITAAVVVLLFIGVNDSAGVMHFLFLTSAILIILTIFGSLLVSMYVYDLSGLYKFDWIKEESNNQRIININAGFDETSNLLHNKFKHADLLVLDFYNPLKHTEVSIKRARKYYPAYPGTLQVETNNLPVKDQSTDKIFLVLAAHEIRSDKERIVFFKELNRILKPQGRIFVTEHLRDVPNFIAYNIGFLHFLSRKNWTSTFDGSDFTIEEEIKQTPFISTFILRKNGNTF